MTSDFFIQYLITPGPVGPRLPGSRFDLFLMSFYRLSAEGTSPQHANRCWSGLCRNAQVAAGTTHRSRCQEHEYFRCGAWTYFAALEAHHARIFGRCEANNGIAAFDRLVEQVMTRPPYNDARRAFWIVDNCSVPPRCQGRAESNETAIVT